MKLLTECTILLDAQDIQLTFIHCLADDPCGHKNIQQINIQVKNRKGFVKHQNNNKALFLPSFKCVLLNLCLEKKTLTSLTFLH